MRISVSKQPRGMLYQQCTENKLQAITLNRMKNVTYNAHYKNTITYKENK